MTNQIIIKGKKITLTPIAGMTALRASEPLKCSICGEYRPFFYHIQIGHGDPSMLICAEECHEHLQHELMAHSEDHFLIRGIEAPTQAHAAKKQLATICFKPDYYDADHYVPDILKSTKIRVISEEDARFVSLVLDADTESRAVIMHVCARHASTLIQGYLRGLEMGYVIAEELAENEAYELSQKS